MIRTTTILGLAFALFAVAASADTYPKNTALDVDHYRFEIELFDGEQRIEATATIDLNVVGEGVRTLAFDLVDQDSISSDDAAPRSPKAPDTGGISRAKGMEVGRVRLNGIAVPFSHADARLSIALASSLAVGTTATVEIEYQGEPADALGIGPNKHGT